MALSLRHNMQKDELYHFKKHYWNSGRNMQGWTIIVDRVEKCKMICSGHKQRVCKDQWIYFHVLPEGPNAIQYDECIFALEEVTNVILTKPDHLFEVL